MGVVPDYEWTKDAAINVKAVWDGAGDPQLQRRMLVHLVEVLCGVNQIGFDPDNPNVTAFNAGRKWVARQIQNAITLPMSTLVKEEPNEPRPNRIPTATERAAAAAGGQPAAAKRARSGSGGKRPTGGSYTGF